MNDDFAGRRETDQLLELMAALQDERWERHQHAHQTEHQAHAEKHNSESEAIDKALDAVDRERTIHAAAHTKEHDGHQREHGLNNLAIEKAEGATDKRFSAVNATREQMADILRNLATKESVDALTLDKTRRWEDNRKELDRRFDELRVAVTNIEKGDVKQEGRGIGQTAVVGLIVGAVGVMGTIISAVVVMSNFLTGP